MLDLSTIEADLRGGFLVKEPLVDACAKSLADAVLSPEARGVFDRVSDFYSRLCDETEVQDEYLRRSDTLAKILLQHPLIEAVVPAGQFHAGMYNPIARRFLSLCDYTAQEIPESVFTRRDLPDFDFLTIVKDVPALDAAIGKMDEEARRVLARETITNHPAWGEIAKQLELTGFTSAIKFTSSAEERRDVVSDFMTNEKIAVCLGNPVPLTLWNQMDLLFEAGDHQYLNCVRDCIIGLEPPVTSGHETRKNIVTEFRINYFLRLLEAKPLTEGELFDRSFLEVAETMPHRPPHRASPGLLVYSRDKFIESMSTLASLGFASFVDYQTVSITDAGRKHLDNSRTRRKFLFL